MGQCAARGPGESGRGEEGAAAGDTMGVQTVPSDIMEEEEEKGEESIYAGRDLVLRQTSRALQSIVSTRGRGWEQGAGGSRRSWRKVQGGGRKSWEQGAGGSKRRRQRWGVEAFQPIMVEEGEEELYLQQKELYWPQEELYQGDELYLPGGVVYRMDRVPAYRYGEDEEELSDPHENPCDLDYQTQYRYADTNNQFLVKEVVKKPGCETFEIDFGDGLVTPKPAVLGRRGGRGRGRGGRGGRGSGLTVGKVQARSLQRVSSFKRKVSLRKGSVAGKSKDDISGPGRQAGAGVTGGYTGQQGSGRGVIPWGIGRGCPTHGRGRGVSPWGNGRGVSSVGNGRGNATYGNSRGSSTNENGRGSSTHGNGRGGSTHGYGRGNSGHGNGRGVARVKQGAHPGPGRCRLPRARGRGGRAVKGSSQGRY